MTVWRLIAHHDDPERAVRWTRREGRIATGWACTGDLAGLRNTPEEFTRAILAGWPASHNATPGGKQLWNFVNIVKKGDLVIVSTGGYRALVAQVTGDYEFADARYAPVDPGDYLHQRTVDITGLDPERVWQLAGRKPVDGHSIRWTFIRCLNDVNEQDL
jgi:predicted Mrr-cat superfamily restriction endonuclease